MTAQTVLCIVSPDNLRGIDLIFVHVHWQHRAIMYRRHFCLQYILHNKFGFHCEQTAMNYVLPHTCSTSLSCETRRELLHLYPFALFGNQWTDIVQGVQLSTAARGQCRQLRSCSGFCNIPPVTRLVHCRNMYVFAWTWNYYSFGSQWMDDQWRSNSVRQ